MWLSISFYSRSFSNIKYRYYVEREANCLDEWNLLVDGSIVTDHEYNDYWRFISIPLERGYHTLRWVGTRDPSRDSFGSIFRLDNLIFSPGVLFSNAILVPEYEQLEISLAPGEIRDLSLDLHSQDGKSIEYIAVLRQSNSLKQATESISLVCNQDTFQAGSEDLYLISLYNSDQTLNVYEINIELPDDVIASSVGSFNLPGETPLLFTGDIGSLTRLSWSNEAGCNADSLRCGFRLIIDANLSHLVMPYEVHTRDTEGLEQCFEGSIELSRVDEQMESLYLLQNEGRVSHTRTSAITMRANQNLLIPDSAAYDLEIYYNGNNMLTIPINISYDSNPAGFYDTAHLKVYPNPCMASTKVAYSIPATGRALLEVFNIRGQKVRTLVDYTLAKGYYRTIWDTCDDRGNPVGSGVYFCRLKASKDQEAVIRFVVLR